MNDDDLYRILGVARTATAAEIKEQFRFLSHAYHPDKFATEKQRKAAEEQFKKVNEAYRVLSDPASRARYDASRAASSDPPPRSTASRPVKPKKNILKILILCIILSGMIAVVVEYQPLPKAGVANDAQQVASLIGSYQWMFRSRDAPLYPVWFVETFYADGTCNVNSYWEPNENQPANIALPKQHFAYRFHGDTLTLGDVDSANHFHPGEGINHRKVIKDSTGRVTKLYDPANDVMWNRIK